MGWGLIQCKRAAFGAVLADLYKTWMLSGLLNIRKVSRLGDGGAGWFAAKEMRTTLFIYSRFRQAYAVISDTGLCFLESVAGRVMAALLTYSCVAPPSRLPRAGLSVA